MAKREEETQRRVQMVADDFETYLRAYDRNPPFKGLDQLNSHRQTIALRRELGSVAAAVDDARFLRSLYETLQAWGVGKRASILRPYSQFAEALGQHASAIAALEGLCIDDPAWDTSGVNGQLWKLISELGLVENKAKLVAHSKALHHLLPELLPPIDRAWTGSRFFSLNSPQMQNKQEEWFREAWRAFVYIARQAQPGRYVTGQGWRTSRSKLLDNAMIGYCRVHQCPRAA